MESNTPCKQLSKATSCLGASETRLPNRFGMVSNSFSSFQKATRETVIKYEGHKKRRLPLPKKATNAQVTARRKQGSSTYFATVRWTKHDVDEAMSDNGQDADSDQQQRSEP